MSAVFKFLSYSFFTLVPLFFQDPSALAQLPVGSFVPPVILKEATVKEQKDWLGAENFKQTHKSVHVLFYVAPGQRDVNAKATAAIRAKNFSKEHLQSWAVINLKASILPDWILKKRIKKSQEEFPNTLYILDSDRVLEKAWQFKDNSNDVVVVDDSAKVLYSHDGLLSDSEILKLLSCIEGAIESASNKNPKSQASVGL